MPRSEAEVVRRSTRLSCLEELQHDDGGWRYLVDHHERPGDTGVVSCKRGSWSFGDDPYGDWGGFIYTTALAVKDAFLVRPPAIRIPMSGCYRRIPAA